VDLGGVQLGLVAAAWGYRWARSPTETPTEPQRGSMVATLQPEKGGNIGDRGSCSGARVAWAWAWARMPVITSLVAAGSCWSRTAGECRCGHRSLCAIH
jgi:hypothetical protein